MEYNLVEMWLRKDPRRWLAGAVTGAISGIIALVVAMLLCQLSGYECWFPVKLMASAIYGGVATEYGMNLREILTGLVFFEVLCIFLGFIYSHFVGVNSLKALVPMGLVWGIFSWIFIWNLFMQSFKPFFAARIPAGGAFPVCIAFGVSLALLRWIDPIFRRA